jgi:hypothetical protein
VTPSSNTAATLYCCAPECRSGAGYSDPCGSPALSFSCDDPVTPTTSNPELTCVELMLPLVTPFYCCGGPDTCFPGAPENLALPCGAVADQYYCTGSSPPSVTGRACGEVAFDGGAGIHAFCCPETYAGDGDAEFVTDGAADGSTPVDGAAPRDAGADAPDAYPGDGGASDGQGHATAGSDI